MITERHIKETAYRLIKDAGLWEKFPLPIVELTSYLGFTCHFFIPDEDINNMTSAVNHQKKKIYVNESISETKQRFSIAQQIGNIALYGTKQDYYIEETNMAFNTHQHEIILFAQHLLMPEEFFRKKWQDTQFNVIKIANYFGVEPQQITLYLRKLRIVS